ncbi:MAG: hypothetical protein M1827_001329 [Pycnora praestabilis]|nr:MAG: hypothetical protein M1827_001329 [Pycnora praestabilis]
MTAPNDARFDDISITFEGFTKTFVEKLATTAAVNPRIEAFHSFLKLTQPIDESILPQPRLAEAGRTYQIPFTFVVPERLLPSACRHRCESGQVEDAHLQLPPSLGDPTLAGDGSSLLDDLAPEMTKVNYAIKVKIGRRRESDGKKMVLVEKARKLRIIPASEEQPPLSIDGQDEDWVFRQEKSLRKGMFKGKLGRLTMEAAQPQSLRLPPPKSMSTCPTTTAATVFLRFDPSEEATAPPKLDKLMSKLKIATYFGCVPFNEFPRKERAIHHPSHGLFVESVPLSSRCVESAQWTQHDASSTATRRDSAFSMSSPSFPEPSSAYGGNVFHTANILVPLTLPTNKAFPPTFHSCLVSRVYQLDLSLSVHTPGSVTATTLQIKLPLQISAAGNSSATPLISSSEQEAIDARQLREASGDFFQPRIIAPPSPEYTERAELVRPGSEEQQQQQQRREQQQLPPDYSFFAGASHIVPVGFERPLLGCSPVCG